MFIGEYTHTVDEKKRFSLPAKFRKDLGKKIVVTRGKDHCLFLYPHQTWVSLSEEVKKLGHVESDHRFTRFTFAGASEIEIDSIGRILVPEFLREFADLPAGRQGLKNSTIVSYSTEGLSKVNVSNPILVPVILITSLSTLPSSL